MIVLNILYVCATYSMMARCVNCETWISCFNYYKQCTCCSEFGVTLIAKGPVSTASLKNFNAGSKNNTLSYILNYLTSLIKEKCFETVAGNSSLRRLFFLKSQPFNSKQLGTRKWKMKARSVNATEVI